MLHYDKIDISEVIDPTKSNRSRKYITSHSWFFNHGFKFKNSCHDLKMLSFNASNIVIIAVKNVDHRCVIPNISKSEAINLLENSVHEDCGYI